MTYIIFAKIFIPSSFQNVVLMKIISRCFVPNIRYVETFADTVLESTLLIFSETGNDFTDDCWVLQVKISTMVFPPILGT